MRVLNRGSAGCTPTVLPLVYETDRASTSLLLTFRLAFIAAFAMPQRRDHTKSDVSEVDVRLTLKLTSSTARSGKDPGLASPPAGANNPPATPPAMIAATAAHPQHHATKHM